MKLKDVKLRLHRIWLAVTIFAWSAFDSAHAELPTPVSPTTSASAGDWLSLIKGYAKDAGLVIGLIIATAAFLWVAWISIAKLNEARNGRAEWAEVGLVAVVAAGVLVFIGFLLTEAANVIT